MLQHLSARGLGVRRRAQLLGVCAVCDDGLDRGVDRYGRELDDGSESDESEGGAAAGDELEDLTQELQDLVIAQLDNDQEQSSDAGPDAERGGDIDRGDGGVDRGESEQAPQGATPPGPAAAGEMAGLATALAASLGPGSDPDARQELLACVERLLRAQDAMADTAADGPDIDFAREAAEMMDGCATIAAQWAGALADLRAQGLPPTRKLRCCGSWCCLQLLLGSPDATMEIATEAKRLKDLYFERPAHASKAFVRRIRLKRRRRGVRIDATTTGRAAGAAAVRARTSRRSVREDLLVHDVDGYFQATRRRWRKAYLSAQLPVLMNAGVCIAACTALLHCSNDMLYAPKRGLLHAHPELFKRPHGNRIGLPSLDTLPGAACCSRKCLQSMTGEHIRAQHEQWKDADTNTKRFNLAARMVWDEGFGRVSSRCFRSFYLQLGWTRERYTSVVSMVVEGVRNLQRASHGLAGRRPWNAWPEELVRTVIQHFDTHTLSRPEDHGVRPTDARITSIPDLLRDLHERHPELRSTVKKTAYRRRITQYLGKAGKVLFSNGTDHSVGLEAIELNNKWKTASVLYKTAHYNLQNAQRAAAPAGDTDDVLRRERLRELTELVTERKAELDLAAKALDDYKQPDLDVRANMATKADITATLERRRRGAEQLQDASERSEALAGCVTLMYTVVDDKAAFELTHVGTQRKFIEAYYIGFNGNVNIHSGLMAGYLTPPYASSKSGDTVAWELFLDAVRTLRKSDRVKITNADGGPLNKSKTVFIHMQQFMVDAGLVDISIINFYWK